MLDKGRWTLAAPDRGHFHGAEPEAVATRHRSAHGDGRGFQRQGRARNARSGAGGRIDRRDTKSNARGLMKNWEGAMPKGLNCTLVFV